MPWDEDRLTAVEAEAAQCPTGDACASDVLSLVTEVRRLRAKLTKVVWIIDHEQPLGNGYRIRDVASVALN